MLRLPRTLTPLQWMMLLPVHLPTRVAPGWTTSRLPARRFACPTRRSISSLLHSASSLLDDADALLFPLLLSHSHPRNKAAPFSPCSSSLFAPRHCRRHFHP